MCWGKMALKIQRKQFDLSSSKLFKFFMLSLLFCCLKESTASRPGCNVALGMQNGKIQDWQLSASSKDFGYGPTRGRLNGNGAWCSQTEKPWIDFFQIILDKVRHVSGLATQGYSTFIMGRSYWVKTYAVKYSYDGWTWYWYKDQPLASTKEFDANTDATTVKEISFHETFVTKYLRIYPITFENDMCLRVEIYGCPNDKALPPTPSTTTSAPSTSSPPSSTNISPSPKTDTITTITQQFTSLPPTDPGSPPATDAYITKGNRSSPFTRPNSAGGNELARMEEDNNVGMLVGVAMTVPLVVVILVIVWWLCFFYRRRQRRKDNSMPAVAYTATPGVSDQAPIRNGSSQGKDFQSSKTSISNPNYDKTVIDIPESEK